MLRLHGLIEKMLDCSHVPSPLMLHPPQIQFLTTSKEKYGWNKCLPSGMLDRLQLNAVFRFDSAFLFAFSAEQFKCSGSLVH